MIYEPTNVVLEQQPDGKYIDKFDLPVLEGESVREVVNIPLEPKRPVVFELEGSAAPGAPVVIIQVQSKPYDRHGEEGIYNSVASGGKEKGSSYTLYA